MRLKRSITKRRKARAIIAKDRPPCWICGDPIDYSLIYPDPDCFTVDHEIAIAAGGSEDLSNCRPSHNRCNREKGAKPFAAVVRRSGSLR